MQSTYLWEKHCSSQCSVYIEFLIFISCFASLINASLSSCTALLDTTQILGTQFYIYNFDISQIQGCMTQSVKKLRELTIVNQH